MYSSINVNTKKKTKKPSLMLGLCEGIKKDITLQLPVPVLEEQKGSIVDHNFHPQPLEDGKNVTSSIIDKPQDKNRSQEKDSLQKMDLNGQQNLMEFEENYETFLASDEDGQTKLYFGPFTEKLKLQVIDFETNQVKPLKNINLIQNGLIIELHQYWAKQKYKIARLCHWIRSLCPLQLNFTDPSLYVKVKNLMKAKHKQIIRTRTKKFAGCYRNFQYSHFFKSENFTEEIIDETEKEKELRLELKRAEKTMNRQMKDLARKDAIIKSMDYHSQKLSDEILALKEELKSVKRENKSLLLKVYENDESSSTSDDIRESSKKKKKFLNMKFSDELWEGEPPFKKRKEKASSSIPEIASIYSLSPKKEIVIEPEISDFAFSTMEMGIPAMEIEVPTMEFEDFNEMMVNQQSAIKSESFGGKKRIEKLSTSQLRKAKTDAILGRNQDADIKKILSIKLEPLSSHN